ncbi:MAG: hypothetical protein ACYS26_10635, partial [Planctomycetota bacterium]
MARARRVARMGAGVLLFIGLGQAQEDGPPAADLREQTTGSEVLSAGGDSTAAPSLEERWAAALDAGIGALTPELTDAILAEAQSKGLWELELDVRYWIGHRAFFFEGPDEAHLHWRFLTDLEPDDVHRSHISRAENSVGLIYMLRGDWVTARDHNRLALQLAEPGQRNQPRINLANAEIELGEWRSAVRLYARALEEATPREAFACLAGLSNVCLDVGLLDAVRALDGAAQALLDDPEIDPVADVGPWSQYALDERACRMLLKAGAFRAAQQGLEDLRREVAFEDLSWTSRQSFAEMLAELALETGRPEHALATLDENRLLNPEHSATPSEWMLRASALARLSEWEQAWEALENCDPDQLSSQSQGFEDFWTLFGELAVQTGRQAEEALARRRVRQAEQFGVQLTRSDLLATFTLPGLRPFVGHLAVEAAPEELRGADSSAGGESPQAADSPPSVLQPAPDAAEPLTSVDRRLWLLNGAGLAALLMVAMSWWFQWRRNRELDRLQAALDVLEESRLPGAGPRERRSASHRALEATLELLDLGSGARVFPPEWGGDEGDVDRMLELAGDCLRLHRLSVGRAGVVRVRS